MNQNQGVVLPNAPKEVLEAISREYEKTLNIPAQKPKPQWMLMPVGMIGAGKTTVLRPLAEQLNLIRVSTDEVRKILKEKGYSYEGCREIAHAIQKKYLDLGYSIAVDANTGSEEGIKFNERSKGEYPHVRQIFIHINPPVEFIINKLKNYKHSWLFKDGEHAVERFLFHKQNFKLPNLPFVYTFDTSKENIKEQVDECVKVIRQELSDK
jgi:shikimate kinase